MNFVADQRFPKSERITSRTTFNALFTQGQCIFSFPFLCKYRIIPAENFSCKVAVSVSKKKFKHAVDRNKVKRMIKECYRKQKISLYNSFQSEAFHLDIIFVFSQHEHYQYEWYELKFKGLINKLIKDIQKNKEKKQ